MLLESDDVFDLMYGGAKGGGKSVFGCIWSYYKAKKTILDLGLRPAKHPMCVGFMGRKQSIDFNTTTLETWKKFIHQDAYYIRKQEKLIILEDTVSIRYGGMDNQETINKFNSAEFAFVFIDQAEEISRTDLALLKGTLRIVHNGKKPDYKVLLTANPAPSFLRADYIESPRDNSRFIQALPADNPYLPKEYIDNLCDALKHRPELIEAYINGSWDQLEGSDILIKHKWILDCVNKQIRVFDDRRVTVCDVSRFGDDETVIYNMIDNCIVSAKIYGQKDTTHTANYIVQMANSNESDIIAIDSCGMGAPVVDMVKQLLRDTSVNRTVMEINSAQRPEQTNDGKRYVNLRAQMWFYAAHLIAEGMVSIPNDQDLIGQLTSVKYYPNGPGGKFGIEKKEATKARLDRSPDRADAFVYGLWATKHVTKKKYDFNRASFLEEIPTDSYGWNNQLATPDQSWGY